MQELVLIQPGRTAAVNLTREAEQAAARREFEERLAECGPLAFRVARGVLRNTADAEDVAQEALLRGYCRFERLRDRNRFRAWLVRITFRLALDRARLAAGAGKVLTADARDYQFQNLQISPLQVSPLEVEPLSDMLQEPR